MILDISNPLEILMFGIGVFCLLRKVGEMERFHELRVGVLTIVISMALSFSWFALVESYEDRVECDCDSFTLSEMVKH